MQLHHYSRHTMQRNCVIYCYYNAYMRGVNTIKVLFLCNILTTNVWILRSFELYFVP